MSVVLAPVVAVTAACSSTDVPSGSDAQERLDTDYTLLACDSLNIEPLPACDSPYIEPLPACDSPYIEPLPACDSPNIEPPASAAVPTHDLGASHEAFQAITMGMSLEQVADIIGFGPFFVGQIILTNAIVTESLWVPDLNSVLSVRSTDSAGVLSLTINGIEPTCIPSETVTNVGVTSQARQALYIGMSMEDVEAVIGFPGERDDIEAFVEMVGEEFGEEEWQEFLDSALATMELELFFWVDGFDNGDYVNLSFLAMFSQTIIDEPFISIGFNDGLVSSITSNV